MTQFVKIRQNEYHDSLELLLATMELEDELGREASLFELSDRVGLPEENVKELIRISLSAAEFANRDAEREEAEGKSN